QLEFDPIARLLNNVVVKQQGLIGIGLDNVKPAIIVEVSDSNAAAIQIIGNAGIRCNILEGSVSQIAEEFLFLISAPRAIPNVLLVIQVRNVESGSSDDWQNQWHIAVGTGCTKSVDHKQIEPSIIVKVREFGRPSPTGLARARLFRNISETAVAIVVPQHVA